MKHLWHTRKPDIKRVGSGEAANIKKVTVKLSLDLYKRMTESPDFENMNKFIKEAIEAKLNKEIDHEQIGS